jgi:hypothetical protein
LWDYYLNLISRQDETDAMNWRNAHIISIHPGTGRRPFGQNGRETAANFNFFYLYNGPSTQSGLIPPEAATSDVTDETINVETDISYYYLAKVKDPAGTGDTMYEIWYGEQAHFCDPTPDYSASGMLVWLAVPPDAARIGSRGTVVTLQLSGSAQAQIYGRPTSNDAYQIGVVPNNSIFVSMFTVIEDGTNNLWYEINYNHRQAWVPATEVIAMPHQNG